MRILPDVLKGNLPVNDLPWIFLIILSASSILLLVTGLGLFLLKRWARKLAIPLLTIYSIGSVMLALVCQIVATTMTIPPLPGFGVDFSAYVIRMTVSILGLNAAVSLAFRMMLRDNRVGELFGMDTISQKSKEDAKRNETIGAAPPNCTYEERIKYYSLADLDNVKQSIDKRRLPDRYQLVIQEIEKRMKQ